MTKPRYRWNAKYKGWLLAIPWAAAREYRYPDGTSLPMWLMP